MHVKLPVLLGLVLFSCAAPKTAPSVGLSGTVGSEYLFRGATQNERGALQGQLSVSSEVGSGTGFVSVWGHMDHSNDTGDAVLPNGNGGKFSEIDTTAGYSWGSDSLSYQVGVIGYQFPNGVGASTNEAYATLGFNDLPFSPSLSAYKDFDLIDGFYGQFALGHGFTMSEEVSLSLGVSLGWSSEAHSFAYYGTKQSGLADLVGTVSLNWAPEDMPTFSLSAQGSSMMDNTLSRSLEAGSVDGDTVLFLLSVSRSY